MPKVGRAGTNEKRVDALLALANARAMQPGPQGPAGPTGATGPQGIQGPQGAQGPQGIQGNPGAAGATGAQGPQGNPGAAGATGAQGAQGNTGAQGPQGNTGAQGPAGANGVVASYKGTQQLGVVGTVQASISSVSDVAVAAGQCVRVYCTIEVDQAAGAANGNVTIQAWRGPIVTGVPIGNTYAQRFFSDSETAANPKSWTLTFNDRTPGVGTSAYNIGIFKDGTLGVATVVSLDVSADVLTAST